MTDVDFFLDPICPWCWITSRWITEVSEIEPVHVNWRFISLTIVNEDREVSEQYKAIQRSSSSMIRVLAAARDAGGNDALASLYTELGTRLHTEGRSADLWGGGDTAPIVAEALEAAGLSASLADAAGDDAWDAVLRKETELALSRTGPDVGTPIITFDLERPDESSLFGPVINRIPRGEEAVELWNAVSIVARTPGIAELKRSLRGEIDFS